MNVFIFDLNRTPEFSVSLRTGVVRRAAASESRRSQLRARTVEKVEGKSATRRKATWNLVRRESAHQETGTITAAEASIRKKKEEANISHSRKSN